MSDSHKSTFLALDIGGTFIKVSVLAGVDPKFSDQFATPSMALTPDEWWRELFRKIMALLSEQKAPAAFDGIGCAIPGTFHYASGHLRTSPNLPVFNKRNVQTDAQNALPDALQNTPFVFMNDADAAGLGIARHFKHKDCVALTLGTGCGSAVIVGGHLWIGPTGYGSEIGHMTLDPHSERVCGCGKKGCVEAYLGEAGLRATAQTYFPDSKWPDRNIGEHLATLSDERDPEARAVFRHYGEDIGLVFSNLINAFGITRFYLTGGLSASFQYFSEGITFGLTRHKFAYTMNDIEIAAAPPDNISYAALGLASQTI